MCVLCLVCVCVFVVYVVHVFLGGGGSAHRQLGHHCDPQHDSVKVYCAKCGEAYAAGPAHAHVDGAAFGPTFPPLFFMTYGDEVGGRKTPWRRRTT